MAVHKCGYDCRNTYMILSVYRLTLMVLPGCGDYTSSKSGCLEFYAHVESLFYTEIFDIFVIYIS